MPLRELASRLSDIGFRVSPGTLADILRNQLGLGRRKIAKVLPLGESLDRATQFERLTELRKWYTDRGWPVVSVDTKKKELLGKFSRHGRSWTDGQLQAFDHDFGSAGNGKVIPYGVYDTVRNDALVYLATGADTGELAGGALRRWWIRLGRSAYPKAGGLLVLADCGGSNGYRVPLYREHLYKLASLIGMPIRVAHLPPYCSKYNPIDHRLFCHLTRALAGKVCETLGWMQLHLSKASTSTGLRVTVEIARKAYLAGQKASKLFRDNEPTMRDRHLGAYNYILPAQ